MNFEAEEQRTELEFQVNSFWNASCDFYELIAVKNQLLNLQNKQSKNVNLILFGLWSSFYDNRIIDQLLAEQIIAKASRAQLFAQRIRELRWEFEQQWETPYSTAVAQVRNILLETELEVEGIHQKRLIEASIEYQSAELVCIDLSNLKVLAMANLKILCGPPEKLIDYQWLIDTWQNLFGISTDI